MGDRPGSYSRVRTSEDKVCRKDMCWSVRERHVLVCEGSLCPRKLSDVSGPGLEEAGRYTPPFPYTHRMVSITHSMLFNFFFPIPRSGIGRHTCKSSSNQLIWLDESSWCALFRFLLAPDLLFHLFCRYLLNVFVRISAPISNSLDFIRFSIFLRLLSADDLNPVVSLVG